MQTMSTRTRSTSRAGAGGRTATLLSSASDEAATSLLPGLLSITLSASPVVLGAVEGVAGAVDGLARLGGGALAEDPRRRRYISVGSYAVMTALTGLIAAAASGVQVGALRAGSAAARGLRSPQRYASVPERAGRSGYGRVFGYERSLHHLAAVAGPALAFAALALLGLRPALLVAALPGVVAVAIGLVLLRRAPAAGPAPAAQRPRLQVRAVYQGRIGSLMAGITLFELANFAAVLLILRATKLLEVQDVPFGAAAMAVLLYLLWRLAAAGSSLVSGRATDRFGPVPVMATGVVVLLVGYAGFAYLPGTVAQLAVCFAVAGAASGAIEAAEHVGVAQVASPELRWSAFGALSAVRSFGRMTATVGATVVWTLLGAEFGLLVAAPLMLAAVGVMARGLPGHQAAAIRGVAVALAPAAAVLLVHAIGIGRNW
jgi:MFS family permease